MRCINSMPDNVIAALLKRLKPSMAFDVGMVLFNQIVEIFRASNLCVFRQQAVFFHFTHRAM